MRTKIILTAAALVPALLFGFQNCSQVKLEEIAGEIESLEAPSLAIKASYCPDSRTMPGDPSKYVFVIDMSSSNVGEWDRSSSPFVYFDPSKGTDPKGDRFKAVEKFLATCGNQTGAQFAVIGFSNGAGLITGSGSSRALTCTNVSFGNAAKATQDLTNLYNGQEADRPWYEQWKHSTGKYLTAGAQQPPILAATSYRSALECASPLIVNDLTSGGPNLTERYHVFFISDGVPTDKIEETTGCNQPSMSAAQKSQCHMDAIVEHTGFMRHAAFAKGKDLRIHAIFYGRQQVPVHIDAVAKEGGTSGVMQLDSFSQDQNVLCSLVIGQLSIDLRPDSLAAINMTSTRKNGMLQADSDMDGLTDLEETQLGYDPANPRSAVPGVLDGICERLGGLSACQAKRSVTVCQPELYNKSGLTDCDVRMLGLHTLKATPDWGVDSDGDGILDFIEIVKGTDPSQNDLNRDPDSDGIITRAEIEKGTDPFTSDLLLPNYQLNNYQIKYSPLSDQNGCDYGRWEATVSRIQAGDTISVERMPSPVAYLNHAANEHVVIYSYRLTPQNSARPVSEFFWGSTVVRVQPDSLNPAVLGATVPHVTKSEFTSVGEVEL